MKKKRQKIKIKLKGGHPSDTSPKNYNIGITHGIQNLLAIAQRHKILFFGSLLLMIGIILIIVYSLPAKNKESLNVKNSSKTSFTNQQAFDFGKSDVKDIVNFAKTQQSFDRKMVYLESKTKFQDVLSKENIPESILKELSFQAQNIGIENLKKDAAWTTISFLNEDLESKKFWIYEPNPSNQYLIQLHPAATIRSFTKEESIKLKAIAGIIRNSLWDALLDNGGDLRVIPKMEEALKYVVDFYRVKTNDKYKLIYEEIWVDGKMVDVGALLAVSLYTNDNRHQAFYFKDESMEGFFDRKGQSMKRKFLQSPVKFNRITSAYNPERVHPVIGEKRPHLGTDFFAKLGEPIFAVSDGTITEAKFKKHNGYYIKIRHDDIYETQYLHIKENGFAPGIKRGAIVKQGQTIGFAGQTGLATGVHVCYRFWKNGRQVDPRQEEVVQTEVPQLLDKKSFRAKRDSLLDMMYEIPFYDGAL